MRRVMLILAAVAPLAYGVAQFEEAGLIYETIALWNLSGAPVLGEGRLVGELLTSYLGRNPDRVFWNSALGQSTCCRVRFLGRTSDCGKSRPSG